MRLLDVNVLVALVDSAHTHHQVAGAWFKRHSNEPWATCPITENGFVRVISDRKYPNLNLSPAQAADLLTTLKQNFAASHRWWPDDVAITDSSLFRLTALTGAKQTTDAYLLGLAFRNKGRVLSLDRGLPWQAINGAAAELVERIR